MTDLDSFSALAVLSSEAAIAPYISDIEYVFVIKLYLNREAEMDGESETIR